jgi:hypothetical protein
MRKVLEDKYSEPAIVLVYFGNQIPKYVYRNLQKIAENFSEKEVIFITDNPKAKEKFRGQNIATLIIEDDTFDRYGLYDKLDHDWCFREGFWQKTLARLLALCEFQIKLGRPILHIEADIILSSNFPFHRFASMPNDVAFSMMSKNIGVASVLYLRSQEASSHLLKYILKKAQENPATTDMSVLGQYKLDHPDKVFSLPHIIEESNPLHYELEKNASHMKGYFDPAQFGQYFFGVDERNSKGWRRLFDRDLQPQVFSEQFKLRIVKGRYLLSKSNREYDLFTLHIHSKDLRAFEVRRLSLLTYWRSVQLSMGVRAVPTRYILKLKYNWLKHQVKIFLRR